MNTAATKPPSSLKPFAGFCQGLKCCITGRRAASPSLDGNSRPARESAPFSSALVTKLCWDILSHSLRQLEKRILNTYKCRLTATGDSCSPREPHPFSKRSQPASPGVLNGGMGFLTHISLTDPCCYSLEKTSSTDRISSGDGGCLSSTLSRVQKTATVRTRSFRKPESRLMGSFLFPPWHTGEKRQTPAFSLRESRKS